MWCRDRRGETPGGHEGHEGSDLRNRVTPARSERIHRRLNTLESRLTILEVDEAKGMRGRRLREEWLAVDGGKSLKVEAQGCYRHETRPERLESE